MRSYYRERHGLRPTQSRLLGTVGLGFALLDLLDSYRESQWLVWAEGQDCKGLTTYGVMGSDASEYSEQRIGMLWLPSRKTRYTREQLFDLIEFSWDHVAKPVDHRLCQFCGQYHVSRVSLSEGQELFREHVNGLLSRYEDGAWELDADGQVIGVGPHGLRPLMDEPTQSEDPGIIERVDRAVRDFRRHNAGPKDRLRAVRELADVLEKLRPSAKEHLASKDERELFQLVNGYAIRHFNASQRDDYDLAVWVDWEFYYLLATVRLLLALEDRATGENASSETGPGGARGGD